MAQKFESITYGRTFGLAVCLVAGLASVTACAPLGDVQNPSQSPVGSRRQERLSTVERQRLLPNPLFDAVFNEDLNAVMRLSETHPQWLEAQNEEFRESPLGMALRLGFGKEAFLLLPHVPTAQLTQKNKNEESLVFLASRSGLPSMIRAIADRMYLNLGSFEDFSFAKLDQPDKKGRRALFVAKDRRVIEALREQYYRGTFEIPIWAFTQARDLDRNTFLHVAAQDNRADVSLWAVQTFCQIPDEEGLISTVKNFGLKALRLLHFSTRDFGLPSDLVINRTNSNDETALHIASRSLSIEFAAQLLQCGWLNTLAVNKDGDTALHVFLKALDQRLTEQPQNFKSYFRQLMKSLSQIQAIYRNPHQMLQIQNRKGQTAAHLAALIADPVFYQELQDFFPIDLPDQTGMTPLQTRTLRSQQNQNPSVR